MVIKTPAMSAVDADICVLTYSLCEGRALPVLVTDLIAGYLDEQDLLNINTLSRTLNNQANLIIYRDVVLDLGEPARFGQKAVSLFRTLLTSRTANNNIQSLSLNGDPLALWRMENPRDEEGEEAFFRGKTPPETLFDLSSFTPKEIELYRRMPNSLPIAMRSSGGQISLPRLCLTIISLITRLRHLHISSDYFRYPDFRKHLRDMVELGGFQNLQSSSLCLDLIHGKHRHINSMRDLDVVPGKDRHIDAVRDWDSALLTPFLATNIESIAVVMSLKPETFRQLRIFSITRLVLHHLQIQDSDLNALLAATPRLRYLEYHASVDYGWFSTNTSGWTPISMRHSIGLEPLFDALQHVNDTLEELVISQRFDEDSMHFQDGYGSHYRPPSRQRDELSKLKHLHTLSIPYTSLFRWIPKEVKSREWHKILPASLREITLTDHLSETFRDRTDESLMPVISGLLDWLATRKQGSQPTKFGLLLLHLADEFNEPVRQTLARLCEKHGILCSIEKRYKDRPKPPIVHMPRGRGGRGRGGCGGRGSGGQGGRHGGGHNGSRGRGHPFGRRQTSGSNRVPLGRPNRLE